MDHVSLGLSSGAIWLFVPALLISTAFAIWTYRHTVPRATKARRYTLIALRSLGIAFLLFALFRPVLTLTKSQESTPAIGLVLDNSQSMQLSESGAQVETADSARSRRSAMIGSVSSIFSPELLKDSAKLQSFSVGDKTSPIFFASKHALDTLKTNASVTDLSSVFRTMKEVRGTKNIEAIVLYTDGSFTAGSNPIYSAEQLGVPVYAVGLGDSSEVRDVSLTQLFTNEVATVGVTQPVDLTVHAAGMKAGEQVTVSLYAEEEKLGERTVLMKDGASDQQVSFQFTPKKEGIVKLSARATKLSGEITEKNNVRLAYVKVLKNKFHVALFAGAPSSDVAFVRSFFENSPSIELKTFIQKQGGEFYEGKPTAAALHDIDLVILIGYPIGVTSDESIGQVRDLLSRDAKPLLFIPSRDIDFAKLSALSDLLPFKFSAQRVATNEIKVNPVLNPQQTENPILHIPPADEKAFGWNALAPLFKTETHIEARPESDVLLEATMQGVKIGEPLLISRRLGTRREIAFTGYGLWQWKLLSFGREQAFRAQSHTSDTAGGAHVMSALDVLLGNAMRWLTTREDDKRVRIEPARKFYEAGERIEFTGQVYDESFQPVDNADVTARVSGSSLTRPLDLVLEPLGNGRYAATLPQGLAAGDYAFTGSAAKSGKSIGTDAGRFNVGEFNIEFAEPRMRADILREMASRTGGKFYTPATAANLLKDLMADPRFKPRQLENKRDYELWNFWPLLVLALLCFSTEWWIRKRAGML
ncbi:MAG: hypothetical protein ABI444_07470 [Candidatus Kapaibacterium sp.]